MYVYVGPEKLVGWDSTPPPPPQSPTGAFLGPVPKGLATIIYRGPIDKIGWEAGSGKATTCLKF